jgi:cell pole-organizing protein PopZ
MINRKELQAARPQSASFDLGPGNRQAGRCREDEELKKYLEGMEERLIERTRDMQKEVLRPMLDAAVESIGTDFSDLRSEMGRRFDLVDQRFDALERRVDRMDTHIGAVLLETAGVSKSLTAGECLDTAMSATQSAQQKAIDDLAARLRAVEKRLEA